MLIQDDYFRNIFNTVREAILILDENMRVLSANRSFFKIFKVDSANTIGSLLYELGNGQWDIPYLRVLLEDILSKNDTVDDYEIEHVFESIGQKTMLLNACKIREKKDALPIILLAIEDITERKEIENGLEKARIELQSAKITVDEAREYAVNIINTVREPLIALDQDLRVVSASRSFYEVFKVNPTETVGQLIYDLGNKQWDIPSLRELLENILPQKATFDDYEVEHDFSDIGRRIMLLNARQIKRASGKERIILLAIEDITERKRLEDLLTDSEEQYRRIFETASDGIVLLEKHAGTIVHVNPATKKMLGYSEEESVGKQLQEIGVSLDTSDFPAIMQALGKSSIINYDEVSIKTKSGQDIFADIYMVDRARLAQCNIRDVTDRKLAEETLKKEKTFIEDALNTLNDIFFVFDLDGRFIRWNKAMNEVIGYTDSEIALMKVTDFFRNDDIVRVSEAFGKAVSEGSATLDAAVVTKEGKQIPHEFKAALLRDHTGKPIGISGVGRDLTERNNLEEQLLQAQKMESVGLLAGGIAHDFNNILQAIMGYGSLLQADIKSEDPLREYVDLILTSADRAAEITYSLLAFSRKQILNPKPVNINALMQRFGKLLSRLIGEDIELSTHFAGKEAISMADAGQIEQVLLNLAMNARDAMPHGGQLTLDTQLVELDETFIQAHGYGEPGMFAVISVSDTGSGMGKETMSKIFEPFFTTKEVGKGTGLGLAMSYGIIKQHNGYINVYSEPEKGTTFRIYLPAIKSTEEVIVKTAAEPLPSRGTETILVAEDDAALRKLFSTVLQSYGYNVILAEDGEEAINKFMDNKDKIQLVMLDMIMPRKSGKEAYDSMINLRPDLKALFSSGYTADRIEKDSMFKEELNFIMKPVSPKDLLKKIREVLDK